MSFCPAFAGLLQNWNLSRTPICLMANVNNSTCSLGDKFVNFLSKPALVFLSIWGHLGKCSFMPFWVVYSCSFCLNHGVTSSSMTISSCSSALQNPQHWKLSSSEWTKYWWSKATEGTWVLNFLTMMAVLVFLWPKQVLRNFRRYFFTLTKTEKQQKQYSKLGFSCFTFCSMKERL